MTMKLFTSQVVPCKFSETSWLRKLLEVSRLQRLRNEDIRMIALKCIVLTSGMGQTDGHTDKRNATLFNVTLPSDRIDTEDGNLPRTICNQSSFHQMNSVFRFIVGPIPFPK